MFYHLGLRRNGGSEKGAHTIELAICIPLVFGFLFGIFDTARLALAYSAVRSGTYQATRRAVALNRSVGSNISSMFGTDEKANVGALYRYPWISDPPPSAAITYYQNNGPNPIYRVEALAIAYAYHIIRHSFGRVSWPCDDEPSCVACQAVRRDPTYQELFCVDETCEKYQVRYIGLECTINVPITSTSIALGWLPPYVPVKTRAYVSMDNYNEVIFDPEPTG